YEDFNSTVAHTISYQWRADEVSAAFNSTGDYFAMFGGLVSSDSGATASWMIRYQPANEGGLVGGYFAVYNGDRGANTVYSSANWVNTGVAVSVGTAYQFVISNDPVTASWSVNISPVGGGTSYQSPELGWRRAAGTGADVVAWGAKVSAVGESL